jgi:uncharacterized protein (DUF779 family)
MMTANLPARVVATSEALALIARLTAQHGPLMFHISGGCCDGSAPLCFARGEFKVGRQDFLLGLVAGDVPVWIGENTFAYWRYTRLILDAAPGRGAGMSLETPEGMRFLAVSELLDDAEAATLDAAGEPPRGAD